MRCRYTTMKLISTILLASTAAALKQRAAPMKALQVPRGGGMVEKSHALTVTKAPCRVLARARPRRGRELMHAYRRLSSASTPRRCCSSRTS